MTQITFYKNELRQISDQLYANTDTKKSRYFHLKSVNNFIEYLDAIKTPDDQAWVYDSLKQYLAECKDLINDINKHTGSRLFDSKLRKVANYYESEMGFSFVLSPAYITIIYLIVFCIIFFLFNPWLSLIAIVVYIFQLIRLTKKYNSHKVYSLFY